MSLSKRTRTEFISKRSKNDVTSERSQPPRVRSSSVKSRGTSRTSRITCSLLRARSSKVARFSRSLGVRSPRWA